MAEDANKTTGGQKNIEKLLSRLRDAILPKLMKGKIRVKGIEKITEKAV